MTGRNETHSIAQASLLAAATFVTRFAFRSHFLYDIDSVNFALAMRRFDPVVHQPHPPGYFLYVLLGRFFHLFLADANSALVAISIAASVLAALGIRQLAAAWFGSEAGLLAGVIFVASPLAWFHGTVALTYIVEACFSVWCGYFFWRVRQGAGWLVAPGALLLGFAAGFRPSSALFLSPLLLFSLLKCRRSQWLAASGALTLAMLAWVIPMVEQSGGLSAYLSSFLTLWKMQGGKQTVFNSSPVTTIVRAFTIGGITILTFGFALAAALVRPKNPEQEQKRNEIALYTKVWLAPGLLFFTFIFLRWINSGYLLVLSPPIFAWLGLWVSGWLRSHDGRTRNRALQVAAAGVACLAHVLVFLFAPLYCSYYSVRQFEGELARVLPGVTHAGLPGNTLVVGFDSHFLGYRHAGYYLPDYQIVQYPEVRYPDGKRVFAMKGGETTLMSRIPTAGFTQFVFSPLPQDDPEYAEYLKGVIARLPGGDLRRIQAGGREYVVAPIRDLGLLFPSAGR